MSFCLPKPGYDLAKQDSHGASGCCRYAVIDIGGNCACDDMAAAPASRYAVIDIGSNTIRLMLEGESKKSIATTRLGHGLASTGVLAQSSIELSCQVIERYVLQAQEAGFIPVAYATSAVRDAGNRQEFLSKIYKQCNLSIDVLSGEREAEYALQATRHDCLIDIGGASFQIATQGYAKSFAMGCVRARDIAWRLTNASSCDEQWMHQREALTGYMQDNFCLPKLSACEFAGVGGSILTLAALKLKQTQFDANAVHGAQLSVDDTEALIDRLLMLGRKRQEHPLLYNRHDVILYGAVILSFIMNSLEITRITASVLDGMEGYLKYIKSKVGGSQEHI